MVALVDHGDAHWCTSKRSCEFETAETRTDNDDTMAGFTHLVHPGLSASYVVIFVHRNNVAARKAALHQYCPDLAFSCRECTCRPAHTGYSLPQTRSRE